MAVRRFIAAGLALLVASSIPLVQAQATSNVTTCPGNPWMLNSKSQTPCLASAYLSAQCNDGQWNVPGIGTEGPYQHPTGDGANLCRCNSVVYDTLESTRAVPYSTGIRFLGTIFCRLVPYVKGDLLEIAGNITIGSYPLPLPAGVAIPGWAYINFTPQDVFQASVAQQYATSGTGSPESASVAGQTQPATSAGASSIHASATSVPISSSRPTYTPAPSTGGSNNTGKPLLSYSSREVLTCELGAIVGGVVGGVLGLAVLALIAWLLIRKKNQQAHTPPSEKYGNTAPDSGYPVHQPYNAGHYAPVPPNQAGGYNNQGYHGQPQPYGAPDTPGTGFKPYDPSDPSTFPATPAPGAPTIYSQGPSEHGQPRPGQYNYAAEL
ncbi:hypothetical protein FRC12_014226 [Ceratobasidium sp. 428]|nr:hypothetical protein FRC12_014226 [Ceratobasidium sp. 428]